MNAALTLRRSQNIDNTIPSSSQAENAAPLRDITTSQGAITTCYLPERQQTSLEWHPVSLNCDFHWTTHDSADPKENRQIESWWSVHRYRNVHLIQPDEPRR